MESKRVKQWILSDWGYAALAILTLTTFVIAQSVYEILAANPQFLVVRRAANGHLLHIIIVFNLLPAVALFSLWSLCRWVSRTLAQVCLSVFSFAFFLAFFWQLHNAHLASWHPFHRSYLLWIVPALLLGLASLRFQKAFHSFVLLLSPAVLLFPSLFLYRTWGGTSPSHAQNRSERDPVDSSTTSKTYPPVFIMVFDELTLPALLDPNGQVDGSRFPNFKELAAQSYWFRNNTSNAEYTERCLSTIFTGRYQPKWQPSEAYKDNLFTLLRPYYRIYIHELITQFCNDETDYCFWPMSYSSRMLFQRDVAYLYATRLLPRDFRVSLPDVTKTWGPFLDRREEMRARVDRFQAFVDSLDTVSDNSLYFFHEELPHSPYLLTPEGRIYDARILHFDPGFAGNQPLLKDIQERYLAQVAFVDSEVGRFIGKLKQLGVYEKALLVVTSDHGVSWNTEAPGRQLKRDNAEMILSVPLFIKMPFQTKGVTTDQDAQQIDLLPTLAGALGVPIPWPHPGWNILDQHGEKRLKIAYDGFGDRFDFGDDLGLKWASANLEPPVSPLVGQKIDTFQVEQYQTIVGNFDNVEIPETGSPTGRDNPLVNAQGWAAFLDDQTVPSQVVVAVNGEIVAVVSPRIQRPDVMKYLRGLNYLLSGWIASFSSGRLHEGENRLAAYALLDLGAKRLALLGAEKSTVLGPARSSMTLTPLKNVKMESASPISTSAKHPRDRSGSATPNPSWLIGKDVDDLDVIRYANTPVRGSLERLNLSRFIRGSEAEKRVDVNGWAVVSQLDSVPNWVIVAVNSNIVAVTSPCCDRPDVAKTLENPKFLRSGWRTAFSTEMLRDGENLVTAYVVVDPRTGKLVALQTQQNRIEVIRK
jgi:sulfur carrier protein ThiS